MKYFICLFVCFPFLLMGQFASPAGQLGTTAIYKDSSSIKAWADSCKVIRGWQDISNKSLGLVSLGNDSAGIGSPNAANGVVSLGDSGIAICYFKTAITNGNGPDFAVFENSFDGLFLELAFVEVSTDGVHYFRFPATSNTDTNNQVNGFGNVDASKINNLAGKYINGYGTPFDLQNIQNNTFLNRDSIHYVKLIDVIGSLQANICSRDFSGQKINDPFPTPFPSGGFDLDAIGVIHQNTSVGLSYTKSINAQIKVYPTQCSDQIHIEGLKKYYLNTISIHSIDHKKMANFATLEDKIKFDLAHFHAGIYILEINTNGNTYYTKIVKL